MAASAPHLTVVFVDDEHHVDPADRSGLVFGRGAALDLDSNPFLHRRVGRFVAVDGVWWLENLNDWTPITVISDGTSAIVERAGRVALVQLRSYIRFEAGSCNYEIRADLSEVPELPAVPARDDDRTATYRPLAIPLTDEQRLLVVALAEARLKDPTQKYRLPTNAATARRLGWTAAKFNRKLDYLCQRLDRQGVAGMRDGGRRANDRRLHLIDHMISRGHVASEDLALLPNLPGDEERVPEDDR